MSESGQKRGQGQGREWRTLDVLDGSRLVTQELFDENIGKRTTFTNCLAFVLVLCFFFQMQKSSSLF